MKKPKIILFDLETSHNIIRAFDPYGFNPSDNMIKERYILTASWKVLGKKKIVTVRSSDAGKYDDDYNVVSALREALCSADAVVGHYSDKFDVRFLNTRLAYHGLAPLPKLIQIDTYKIAKSKFKFNYNRLDYLGQFLKVGRKRRTEPGLWYRCEDGDKAAFKEMGEYNAQDVVLLEKVYLKLRPFAPAAVNQQLFSSKPACEACGSHKVQQRGTAITKAHRYNRYQCQECGHWFRDRKKK